MRHATFVLLVAFAACKGGAAKESCRREAADLQALLRAADTGDRTLRIPRDAKLVMRDDLPEPKDMPPAPVVHLRANRLSIDGNDAASVAGMVDNRGDGRWFVVIDADVAWSRVVEVVSAGMQSPVFVFTGSDPVKAPRRVPIDDAIDAIDAAPDTGAMRIAELMAEQIKSCPSLQKVFGSAAHATIAQPELLTGVVGPLFRSALRAAEVRRRVS